MTVRHISSACAATYSFASQLPTALSDHNGSLSAPNDLDDMSSFRASQFYTSTPLDAQYLPNSPTGSQTSHISEDEFGGSTKHVWRDEDVEDDGESDHGVDDFDPLPHSGEETDGQELNLQHNESPSSPGIAESLNMKKDNTTAASRLSPSSDVDIEGSEIALDEDDAVAEKILTQVRAL